MFWFPVPYRIGKNVGKHIVQAASAAGIVPDLKESSWRLWIKKKVPEQTLLRNDKWIKTVVPRGAP